MVFLKVNEAYGGSVIVNMAKVEQITVEDGGNAKLWFSVDGEDVMETKETYEEIEIMLEAALTGYPGVVSKQTAESLAR